MVARYRRKGTLCNVLQSACREHDLKLADLTVLSNAVDPYRLDTEAYHKYGQWFATQLDKLYGPDGRAHLRGLHYAIVQAGNIRKPDGALYRNSDEEWDWLQNKAAKAARWLRYVPFERITDNRNAAPVIHRAPYIEPGATLAIGLDVEVPDAADIEPVPVPHGFDARQAYHFAVFGEKSSLEDGVLPIAERYHADLYLVSGEISDTLVYQIAKDASEDGRSLVLFTLSDCDPAGHQMPISIARKLQAFRDLFFRDLEFEVVRVALTPEQVGELDLPSTPLKEGEPRADRWQQAFGIEQTEIDALTTPERRSVLQEMLEDAFRQYIDPTLVRRVIAAERRWRKDARKALAQQIDADALEDIRAEAEIKLDALRDEIAAINDKLELAADAYVTLPKVVVPEPKVKLDPNRHALVSFDDDWVTATKALIAHKAYEGGE
jgi:hypothetical protein